MGPIACEVAIAAVRTTIAQTVGVIGDDATMAGSTMGGGPVVGGVFGGRYLVERELGRGGMGRVFAALDRQLGERIALKVLEHVGDDTIALDRFRREVRLARRVTHPNVARIYDIGEVDGTHFLTMELVEGGSLAERCAHGRSLGWRDVVRIATDVARGLDAAHRAGVVHRDLKPANILLAPDGRAVLTDFGVAFAPAGDTRLTAAGLGVVGTPAYMSPEQLRGETLDARTDVYALGLIVFELVVGRLPFDGDNPIAMAIARLEQSVPDLRALVPEIPAELAAVVTRALAVDREGRPADAAAVLAALTGLPGMPTDGVPIAPALAVTLVPPPATAAATVASALTHATSGRRVAVLPLRVRGPEDAAWLGDAMAEDLVDLLSATRGLRVVASSATARFAEGDRDPRTIGRELGVDFVVDGTVARSGATVRVTARLLDVPTGYQVWSERFEGAFTDVFDLQDRMHQRIAETLRVELQTLSSRGDAPPEAIELYLRARKLAQAADERLVMDGGALALLERCLALAPDFKPALAAYAGVCSRVWFMPQLADAADWEARTAAAVAVARQRAPDLAETHLAAAREAVSRLDFTAGVQHLRASLDIAPTCYGALELLGMLELESARTTEGMRRLQLVIELDPGVAIPHVVIARHAALHGDVATFDARMAAARRLGGTYNLPTWVTQVRAWAWSDRRDAIAAWLDSPEANLVPDPVRLVARGFLGREDIDRRRVSYPAVTRGVPNPRFSAMADQIAIEALACTGDVPAALAVLDKLAATALIDLDWLDNCPPLASLRASPVFAVARDAVARRVRDMWAV